MAACHQMDADARERERVEEKVKRYMYILSLNTKGALFHYCNVLDSRASRSKPHTNHLYKKIAVLVYMYVCVCSDTSSTCSLAHNTFT